MIIYAPNVNAGGGLVLLLDLLRSLPSSRNTILFLDQRIKPQVDSIVNVSSVVWVRRSLRDRIAAERKLQKIAQPHHQILCFHGVPPVFSCDGSVSVYVQNRLLLVSLKQYGFPFRVRMRLLYEKWVLNRGVRKVASIFVQTETMADTLNEWLAQKGLDRQGPQVIIAPFSNTLADFSPRAISACKIDPDYDFCYVADGQPHKNHSALFAALRILANEGVFPKVAVTLGEHEVVLLNELRELQNVDQVKIDNLGTLQHNAVFELYENSRALIFPSLLESFGLPLIEASRTGLPIVAGELNFVRDVCNPAQTFDPTAPRSIARAVKRYLELTSPPRQILNADGFLKEWQNSEGPKS